MNHRTSRGEPTPTLTAARDELVGIATAMGDAGVLEVVSDFSEVDEEFATLREMVRSSGRPMTISVVAEPHRASWDSLRDRIGQAAADGLPIKGQVAARAIGLIMGLQASVNPFGFAPSYKTIAGLALGERVAALRSPEMKTTLLRELEENERRGFANRFDRMYPLGDPPDYEPDPSTSVASVAERLGQSPADLAYDLLLEDDGKAFLYYPLFNWVDGSLDAAGVMLRDENLLPGLGDGGAHVGTICDASYPTTLLSYWGRDRAARHGREGLPVEWIIRRQCRDTAAALGLRDRGVLAPGMKADVNIIDFENLRLRAPYMAYDLPSGGKRLLQKAEGYLHTVVSGVETYRNGEPTGALPGRLVRGAR